MYFMIFYAHGIQFNLRIQATERLIISQVFFTARRYAKRGICRRRVSVCVSVCHTPVLYQNG